MKYATGLRTCRNNLVMRQGGVQTRPGTTYVGNVFGVGTHPTTIESRLFPFEFNSDDGNVYVLVFTHEAIQFVRDGAFVLSAGNPYTVVTDIQDAALADVQISQMGDVVTIVRPTGPPATLTRVAETNWVYAPIIFGPAMAAPTDVVGGVAAAAPGFSFLVTAINAVTGQESLPTGFAYPDLMIDGANPLIVTSAVAPFVAVNVGLALAITGDPLGVFTPGYYTILSVDGSNKATLSSSPGPVGSTGGQGYIPIRVATDAISLSWSPVSGASAYNVYKSTASGLFGLVTQTPATKFREDDTIDPDYMIQPPVMAYPFFRAVGATNPYPRACGYFQGRQVFGGSDANPNRLWFSQSGDYQNFSVSNPSEDSDALQFDLVGHDVSQILSITDTPYCVVLTSGAEWVVGGDDAGILRPNDINAVSFSRHSASALRPIQIDLRLLYIQGRGNVARDIAKDPWYGFKGTDLTSFSVHLFEGHAIVDWAYQEVPHSIVWAVREDGVLLSLTDVYDQQVLAWARHDTLGKVEHVVVVPEGPEDAVYLVVVRTIEGVAYRYLERMASRLIAVNPLVPDPQDYVGMDCSLAFDGRNPSDSGVTMTLSGGSTWGYNELLTLTANSASFAASNVNGDQIVLTSPDGTATVALTITQYLSTTKVKGFPSMTVPASMQNAALSVWSHAVVTVTGLDQLDGQAVSVLADGYVVASPYNPAFPVLTVSGGSLTLPQAYIRIRVGLPYVSDIETLDIDRPEGPSLKETKMLLTRANIQVDQSRGIFAANQLPASPTSIAGMMEYKARDGVGWGQPVALVNDNLLINIAGQFQTRGRLAIRQVDPLPLTVLAIIPTGMIPQAS